VKIPLDKQLHLLLCFAICTVASIVHPVVGVVLALGAGVLKEWRDSRHAGNAWSWGDIAFDMAGTVASAVAVFLLRTV